MHIQTTLPLRSESDLYPIQREGIDLILNNPRTGLLWGPGLGKTITIGTAVAELMKREEVRRVLYVAPPRVIGVPRRELAKWEMTRHVRVIDVVGTPAKRLKLLQGNEPGIYCLSYNNLGWLLKIASAIKGFQLLIIDESSKIGDPSSKTTKAVARLAAAIKRAVILTGTPGDLGRIWSQVFCLDSGQRLGVRYQTYLDRYCIPTGFRWVPKSGARVAVSEKIKDICFSASVADHVHELPEVIRTTIEVELPEDARATYDQMEEEMVADLGQLCVTAKNAAVMTGKLTQICDGFLYQEDGTHTVLHTAKLDALQELMEECGDQDPALILYRYKASSGELLKRIPGSEKFKADTPAAMDQILTRWTAGQIPALISHSQSCSHGIDGLQHGGRRLVWMGPIWSSDVHQQAEARLHRSGGKQTVIITTLIATGTIDEVIALALEARLKNEGEFLDLLSDYLKRKHPKQAQSIEERIKAARKRLQETHPDKAGGSAEAFHKAREEFDRLKKEVV